MCSYHNKQPSHILIIMTCELIFLYIYIYIYMCVCHIYIYICVCMHSFVYLFTSFSVDVNICLYISAAQGLGCLQQDSQGIGRGSF